MGKEINIEFKGWQAVVMLLLVGGFVGYRLMTLGNLEANDTLRREIEMRIMMDYLPREAAKLVEAAESGNFESLPNLGNVTPVIKDVQVRRPFLGSSLDDSSGERTAVRIVYALEDGGELRDENTIFLVYDHHLLSNRWLYRYPTNEWRFNCYFF